MALLLINQRYRQALARLGLTTPEGFLHLSGVIYSGHADRHVARVTLGKGPDQIDAFLKKEHRVPWRDRPASAWAGLGFVSKSCREFRLLETLRQANIGCPEPLAAGEDGRGRAFLLVQVLEGTVDLRFFLQDMAEQPELRRASARALGAAIARFHQAGFDHPDLYAKHVLVASGAAGRRFYFLDWQRSRRRRLSWPRRWRDLAALNASVAEELAGRGDRLALLRAYLRSVRNPHRLRCAWRRIAARTAVLLGRRRIREMRQPPLATGKQNLIWMDGEALCLTREFFEAARGQAPHYLRAPLKGFRPGQLSQMRVPVPGFGWGALVRRSARRPLRWLWARVCGRPLPSPELEEVATLFRLQRHGVATVAVLAVGERRLRPWHTESFLLTREPVASVGLCAWLADQAGRKLKTAEQGRRRHVLHQAGDMLRRLHEAGYHIRKAFTVETGQQLRVLIGGNSTQLILASSAGLCQQGASASRARADIQKLWTTLAPVLSRTDALRFFRAYMGGRSLHATWRRLLRGRKFVRHVASTESRMLLNYSAERNPSSPSLVPEAWP